MSSTTAGPSTLDGIKRLAKNIKRERGLRHHLALDEAARAAGYQNIRHAQDQIARRAPALYAIYLSAHWAERGHAGRETLKIQLPKPLIEIVMKRQVDHVRNLRFFRLEAIDHLERRTDVDSQEKAHNSLYSAARALRFMAATGLRPASTLQEQRKMRAFQDLPGHDHASWWIHSETGAWVFMDEPYPKSELARRQAWAAAHGFQMVVPDWEGIYNPGSAVPYLFSVDASLAAKLATQLVQLQATVVEPIWDGESASYFSLFMSPARKALGKSRRSRPMPAYRGVERDGALPYGASRGGETSLWRPAKRMALSGHLTVGPLLYALDISDLPTPQRKVITRIRSLLDDWLQMEYPSDKEMTADQFHEAYYGKERKPIIGRDKQVATVKRVAELLREGYAGCKPRENVLKGLNSIESRLLKNMPR